MMLELHLNDKHYESISYVICIILVFNIIFKLHISKPTKKLIP
jgi:uncharacterized Rmd1/YagE family protein